MAWSWGAVTLDYDEEPLDDSKIHFAKRRAYAFANARGSTKRLRQYLYTDSLEGQIHLHLKQAHMEALDALYQAGDPVVHVNPRPPYDLGMTVSIDAFTAIWDSTVKNIDSDDEVWYNCTLEQTEA